MSEEPSAVVVSQNEAHGEGHDYVKGSPHLRHDVLRSMIEGQLKALVEETLARQDTCRVLEIGAGHGTFTEFLLQAGATVTVTEASKASAEELSRRYAGRNDVEVFFDLTGESVFEHEPTYDAVVCASLLHHIPDYLDFVRRLSGMLTRGGWFYSVQDPLYYPRRTRMAHVAGRGTYYIWRLGQGALRRGLATRMRRLRGTYSDTEPSDLVEYHVVRQGVDEKALVELLEKQFGTVELFTYWSTQSPFFQWMFSKSGLHSDFGLIARDRLTTR
jgi:SAM-dependent methyltransferase